jgi:hypothetical protein
LRSHHQHAGIQNGVTSAHRGGTGKSALPHFIT